MCRHACLTQSFVRVIEEIVQVAVDLLSQRLPRIYATSKRPEPDGRRHRTDSSCITEKHQSGVLVINGESTTNVNQSSCADFQNTRGQQPLQGGRKRR